MESFSLADLFLLSSAGVSIVILFLNRVWKSPKALRYPLPPGPRAKPIIKNLLDLPGLEKQWESVAKLTEEFGDVIHFDVAGLHLIYINDFQIAVDLLERRSSIYSDRLLTPMLELIDFERVLPLTQYGESWRLGRRLFHQEFNATASVKYLDTQIKYSRILVRFLRVHPDDFEQHIKHFASAIILETIYGFQTKPVDDPLVALVQEVICISESLLPGAFLVDIFPFLKHLPDWPWIPGSKFIGTRQAKIWRKRGQECTVIPFQTTVEAVAAGTAKPCFISSWLSRINELPEGDEKEKTVKSIQDVALTAFLGGYETTSSTLMNFVLVMIQYPETQRKAQEELDRVVGRERLPDLSDKENLPYMLALYKEVLRWFPTFPLGIPHRSLTEDEYNGMSIPRGSTILPNAWAMSRNQKEYGRDVEAFNPDRFLGTNAIDPSKFVFGFGRRICPGRYFVENTLFFSMCYMLHLFTIEHAVDENGLPKPVNPKLVSGLATHLEPFPGSFTPRFKGSSMHTAVRE